MVTHLRGFIIHLLQHCLSPRDSNPLSRGYVSSVLHIFLFWAILLISSVQFNWTNLATDF
jgi:hypothetical protein